MGEKTAILAVIVVTVPLAALLIYFAFRNFFASIRNVKDTIDTEVGRSREGDAKPLRDEQGRAASEPSGAMASRAERKPAPGSNIADRLQGATAATLTTAVFAEFQEQAKRSDDAHKAKIRAHVGRQMPPITQEGREALELGKRARLAIKHVFPPRLPQRSMSYFGGLPIVPDDFDWPTLHNRKGLLERLNFMAQIDCSDLPPGPGRHLFPDKGYLYFFAPMSGTFGPDAMHFVARYEPRKVTQKWEPLDMPVTGAIEPGDRMDMIWRGKRTHYDRFEIEFGWIEEPTDDEVAARSGEGHAFKVADKIRAEKLDAFYGPVISPDPMLAAHHAPKDAFWTPYPGFPANWKTARIMRAFVEAYHREETEDVATRLKPLGEVAADNPEAQRLKTLQRELSAMRTKMFNAFFPTINVGHKDYDAPPIEVKQQIMVFLEDLRVNGMPSSKERPYHHLRVPTVINQWLEIAAIHGAEGGLTNPDGAVLISPDVVAALAHRHTSRKHQMLGEGEVVQVAADEMKDQYLLLLQLGPDAALDWTVGEMGPLQYWITPEDLASRKFENTVLTIEAY